MKGIFWLICCAGYCFGQSQWTEDVMNDILEQVKVNPSEAVDKVRKRGKTAYDFGLKVMQTGRYDDALDWYEALTIHYDSAEFLFGKAWVHFHKGELESALEAGVFVLERSANVKIKARCHYMMGQIWLEDMEMEKAEDHFRNSLELYAELNLRGGQYLAYTGLAAIEVNRREYSKAQDFIGKALAFNIQLKRPYTLGYVNDLLAEIAFQKDDYVVALEHSLKAYSEYEKDQDSVNRNYASAKVGLLQVLTGDIDGGYATAKSIDAIVEAENQTQLGMLNNLTWIILYRCSGRDYSSMLSEFRGWIESRKKKGYFSQLLAFSQTVPCPSP